MRSPCVRALLAAFCVLFILVVFIRSDPVSAQRGLFRKPDAPLGPVDQQLSPHDSDAPFSGASVPADNKVPSGIPHTNCSIDITHLQKIRTKYHVNERFQYMKRHVRFTRKEGLERKCMTKLDQNLLNGAFLTVDVNKPHNEDSCDKPLEVQVPASGLPSTVNASDFLFGVSTTLKRFMNPESSPIDEWVFWLTDSRGHSNGGKLLLMLMDANDEELQEVANLLGDAGIDVDVSHSDPSLEMAVRYLSLVPALYHDADAHKKKWLVTCDDDTFFPSMHGLVDKMAEFDHTRQMYIGTLSEDVGALDRHGSQAFGGAGVFLSLPMAEKITELYDSCATAEKIKESNSGWGPQGDILLRKCIYENTETRLTTVWDLWQLDFYGHPAGFYEWGIKPLSLHHYRGGGWHRAKPLQYAKIAYICGEDCTLQRFQTADDFIMSGYSIAHYPQGVTFDSTQFEATLFAAPPDKGWNLDFMMGPRRPNLEKTGRKIAWELEESEVRSDGSVLQTYIRKQDDGRWVHPDSQPMSNIDGIIELVWIPAS
ncbi:hypothetical protein E4U42_006894 [Claviceps africana]|uniref:Fringe-like glycosyltransferase domain-containing protein n=1 Tax=Claviceps africana TaxID=83212 RepID=A0A8K0JCG8_9HYPO|nr:hypothetical protein E4U42_006894 [Claviceps africana]